MKEGKKGLTYDLLMKDREYALSNLTRTFTPEEKIPDLKFTVLTFPTDGTLLQKITQWLTNNNQFSQYCSKVIDVNGYRNVCPTERDLYLPTKIQKPQEVKGKGKERKKPTKIKEQTVPEEMITPNFWNFLIKGDSKVHVPALKDRKGVMILGFLPEGKGKDTKYTLQNFLVATIDEKGRSIELELFCNDPAGTYNAFIRSEDPEKYKTRPSMQLWISFIVTYRDNLKNIDVITLKALPNSEYFGTIENSFMLL